MRKGVVFGVLLGLVMSVCNPAMGQSSSSPQVTTQLLKVQVNPDVPKPKEIFYYGPGASFGLVGALATEADKGPKGQLLAVMEKEDIEISRIILAEAKNQISSQHVVELVDSDLKDADLSMEVMLYGFNKKTAFSSKTYPILKLKMKLTKANGAAIWSDSDFESAYASKSEEGFTLDEMLSDPTRIKSGLTRVAGLAVGNLLNSLKKGLPK